MGKENLHFGQVQVTHGARARARAKMLNNSYRVGNLKKKRVILGTPWDIEDLGISWEMIFV